MIKFFLSVLVLVPSICFAYDNNFDERYKTELAFIEKIKPIALEVNQDVLKERALIEKINTTKLSAKDKKLIDEKAKKYDVFTRHKDDFRYIYLKTKLLGKIDALSPSILIAVAGIETNWGRSRIVKEANSLYKELVWDNSGLKPIGEEKNAGYTIKKFKNLKDSMTSFLLKVNSSVDYEHFRYTRTFSRESQSVMYGRDIAHNFHLKTPLKNYIGMLDYTITFYNLEQVDRENNYYRKPKE